MRSTPAKLVLLLVLTAARVSCSWADPLPAEGTGGTKNLVFSRAGSRDLTLDLYLPTTVLPRGVKRPVVLFLHGGGWRYGSKKEGERLAALFTQRGLAFASADYRLNDTALWPAQIFDAKAAVRWLRAHAGEYGLDPARIGVCGTSAGGHLAALLGTTAGVAALEDLAQGNSRASSRVQAVCDISGPTDLGIKNTTFIGRFFVRHELGGSAQEKPDLARQADPTRYVRGGEPPFFLVYGARDSLVEPEHGRRLEHALRAHGDRVSLDLVPDGGHVPLGHDQQTKIVGFFVQALHWHSP